MAKVKTKIQKKTITEKVVYALFLMYAIFITGMFLYGFISILYALIFDQASLSNASFGYAEGVTNE